MTSSPIDAGQSVSFSARLRADTATLHRYAEGAPFVGRLMRGDLDATAIADLLGQLRFVYTALEEVGRRLRHVAPVAALWDARLARSAAIAADLAVLPEPSVPGPLPATVSYVHRVRITRIDPISHLAHHYQRYLGDLSGGQILQRMTSQHYGVAPLQFYDFGAIGKTKPYKDGYRARLDEHIIGSAAERRFVDEVNEGYLLNRSVFDELGAATDRRLGTPG